MKGDLRFIDLFAGCGGLSLGLLKAGWKGILAIEKEPNAFETLRHNLIDTKEKYKFNWFSKLPIAPLSIEELVNNYNNELRSLRNNVDIIVGGPPCQGFSMAGRRDPNDKRNSMFYEYLKVVELIRPKMILLENVTGFNMSFSDISTDSREYKAAEFLREGLRNLDYYVEWNDVIKAKDCGVPQTRPRFFQFGILKKYFKEGKNPFEFIETASSALLDKKGLKKSVTCKEALSDLELSKNVTVDWIGYQKGFKKIEYSKPLTEYQRYMNRYMKGKNLNSLRLPRHTKTTKKRFQFILENARVRNQSISKDLREMLEKEGLGTKKRTIVPLDPNSQSPTINTLPDDYIHYSEPRILTVRENARLQTFPDWFEFKGKYTTGGNRRKEECPRYTQVGNAVAPFVAEIVGQSISSFVKNFKI